MIETINQAFLRDACKFIRVGTTGCLIYHYYYTTDNLVRLCVGPAGTAFTFRTALENGLLTTTKGCAEEWGFIESSDCIPTAIHQYL